MNYRRAKIPGASYFFTLTLADRTSSLLTEQVNILREVKDQHPFEIEAIVVLPEHLHSLWRLPANDTNYATRWMLIKSGFSRHLPKLEMIQDTRLKKRERGIWQRRYWEHFIRDGTD